LRSTISVAPSILAADWTRLAEEVRLLEEAGADYLHLDVMDGSFVPPISFGQEFVRKIRKLTSIPLDVHLMISRPELHVDSFIDAGADILTFHIEASNHPHRLLQSIRGRGVKAGIALNPGTPSVTLDSLIDMIDLALVMTVNPGWGGQKFISSSLKKIKEISAKTVNNPSILIEVDGGIDDSTAKECVLHGANLLVAGTYIFGSENYKQKIELLKS